MSRRETLNADLTLLRRTASTPRGGVLLSSRGRETLCATWFDEQFLGIHHSPPRTAARFGKSTCCFVHERVPPLFRIFRFSLARAEACYAVPLGLEPRLSAPKAPVLPLHHGTMLREQFPCALFTLSVYYSAFSLLRHADLSTAGFEPASLSPLSLGYTARVRCLV